MKSFSHFHNSSSWYEIELIIWLRNSLLSWNSAHDWYDISWAILNWKIIRQWQTFFCCTAVNELHDDVNFNSLLSWNSAHDWAILNWKCIGQWEIFFRCWYKYNLKRSNWSWMIRLNTVSTILHWNGKWF